MRALLATALLALCGCAAVPDPPPVETQEEAIVRAILELDGVGTIEIASLGRVANAAGQANAFDALVFYVGAHQNETHHPEWIDLQYAFYGPTWPHWQHVCGFMAWDPVPAPPVFEEFFALAPGETRLIYCKRALGDRRGAMSFYQERPGLWRLSRYPVHPNSWHVWDPNDPNPITSIHCLPCSAAVRDFSLIVTPAPSSYWGIDLALTRP